MYYKGHDEIKTNLILIVYTFKNCTGYKAELAVVSLMDSSCSDKWISLRAVSSVRKYVEDEFYKITLKIFLSIHILKTCY